MKFCSGCVQFKVLFSFYSFILQTLNFDRSDGLLKSVLTEKLLVGLWSCSHNLIYTLPFQDRDFRNKSPCFN